jgi:hypothetical protein
MGLESFRPLTHWVTLMSFKGNHPYSLVPDLSRHERANGWLVSDRGGIPAAGLAAKGYDHKVVLKTAVVGENLLPRVNRVASLLQRWLLGTHQGAVAHSNLDYYLDEFTFRFNRRRARSRGLLFYRLIEQSLTTGPVRSRELVGGTSPQRAVVGESSQ